LLTVPSRPASPDLETACGMSAAVAAGEVSAVELTRRALDRLGDWEPVTNAFSQVRPGHALAEARAFDDAGRRGERLALGGVPVAIKDLFDVAGYETTGCCRAYQGRFASTDAELVRRVKQAGAIVLGKTNQHELAAGATNLVSACGPTANPWDPARLTGGSSGGSGAAVASRVVPLAFGSDTGGSIRMPASLCGCWGLKPTTDRLPAHGMMPLAPTLDCPGPMAVSSGDLIRWWVAVDMPPVDAAVADMPGTAGRLEGWFHEWTHPDTWAAVLAVCEALSSLGVDVDGADGDGVDDVREVWVDVAWAEFADAHPELRDNLDALLGPTANQYLHGASLPPARRAQARWRAAEFAAWFEARLSRFDVLVAPATPIAAPRADGGTVEVAGGRVVDWRGGGGLAWFTEPVNLAGLPALSVPVRPSEGGLPLGVQIIGRSGTDELLLALGARLESADPRLHPAIPPLPA
jgi:aspartyl-tRNA(Asn)/glutamyl-tRNA(Gln) amidotransferase subunit A